MNWKLLIAVFSLSLFVFACSGDKEAKNPAKATKTQKKAGKKAKKPVKKVALAAPLKNKKNLKRVTSFQVDKFNEQAYKGAKMIAIPAKDNKITIQGWAVDAMAKKPAGGVLIQIGNKYFPAKYGQARKDVAKNLKNNAFVNSGFHATIPKSEIKKGTQIVNVVVLSHDKKSFYPSSPAKSFKIKI